MATTTSKFFVGLFLILGTMAAISMVIWVGMSGKLNKGAHYVVYFDESVQGLDKDSQVKYRGVSIGRVENIQVAPDGKLIEVLAAINSDLIPKGRLVAQLKSVGITGIMFIEMDQLPEKEPFQPPVLSFKPRHPVIPSRPSDISQIFRDVESVVRRVSLIDFEAIAKKVSRDLDTLDRAVNDADLKKLSAQFTVAMNRLNTILEPRQWTQVLSTVNKAGTDIDARVNEVQKVIEHIDQVVRHVEVILAENQAAVHEAAKDLRQTARDSSALVSSTDARIAGLYRNLLISAQNLEKATDQINSLLESLTQDPGQAILGTPPAPRSVSPSIMMNKE